MLKKKTKAKNKTEKKKNKSNNNKKKCCYSEKPTRFRVFINYFFRCENVMFIYVFN